MKLNWRILLFQSLQALSSMLIVSFVTMFLLQWSWWIQDVAYGSIFISCMTLLGFFIVNYISKYYKLSLAVPISLSWLCISLIGVGLYFFPEYGWFFYGLFGLSVWLYYSWANLIMIQEVDVDIRAYHIAVMQTIWWIIWVGGPILLWLLFSFFDTQFTYTIVFLSIICSGLIGFCAGMLFRSDYTFEHHNIRDLTQALPKINIWYFVMIWAMWAGALKSQLDVIIPHTINISEINISYILAGLKLLSLIIVYLSWKFLHSRYYRALIYVSIALLVCGTLGFVLFYDVHSYSAFAMTTAIWSTLFAFVYIVVKSRRIELMKVSNRAIELRWEITMAFIRALLASIMLFSSAGVVIWKSILVVFMFCFLVWAIIIYRQTQKLFSLD